jgi:hypothetical protein
MRGDSTEVGLVAVVPCYRHGYLYNPAMQNLRSCDFRNGSNDTGRQRDRRRDRRLLNLRYLKTLRLLVGVDH